MQPQQPSASYTAAPGLLSQDWGEDEVVIFSSAHAQTHLVTSAAAMLLAAARASPINEQQALLTLAAGADGDAGCEIQELLRQTLQGLVNIGLLRPV